MSIETRIADSLERELGAVDIGAGDLAGVESAGRRVRRRRRLAATGGAAAVVAALVVVPLAVRPDAGKNDRPAPPTVPVGQGWTRAAAMPLSPRHAPFLAWTGTEVLVLGGHDGDVCPPNADCRLLDDGLRDGAAYDPAADSWRDLPDAPFDTDQYSMGAVVSGSLLISNRSRWWRLGDDGWEDLGTAPVKVSGIPSVLGDRLYVASGKSGVAVLEGTTWTELPPDLIEPRIDGAGIFATELGVVRIGTDYTTPNTEPPLTQVDLLGDDGTWRRLPESGQIGWFGHWTGTALLGLERGGADGGEVDNWGRWVPSGGRYGLAAETWAKLPGLPDDYADYGNLPGWPVEAAQGPLAASGGRVYDDRRQTWTDLGRPDSAIDYLISGVFADGALVTVGGFASEGGTFWSEEGARDEVWIWRP